MEQISIAEPLAKNGETCLSPQAWEHAACLGSSCCAHQCTSLCIIVSPCPFLFTLYAMIPHYIPTLFSSRFVPHERIVDMQHDSSTKELSHQPVPFKVKDYIFADTSRELDTGIAREPGANALIRLDQRRIFAVPVTAATVAVGCCCCCCS